MQSVEDILASLSKDTIKYLFKAKGMEKPSKTSKSIAALLTRFEVDGLQTLVNAAKISTLKEINKDLEVDLEKNPGNTRQPYFKRFKEVIVEDEGGLVELLKDLTKPNIEALYEVMEIEMDSKLSRDELLDTLYAEIRLDGLQVFLSSGVDKDLILQILSDLDIQVDNEKRAKSALITAIITGEMPEVTEKSKHVPKISKSKPKLTSKISYDDCYQWYSLEELQDFARDADLKVSGTKKDVINRVIEHLRSNKVTKKTKKEVEAEPEEEDAAAEEAVEEKENAEENIEKPKKVVKKSSKADKSSKKAKAAQAEEEEQDDEEVEEKVEKVEEKAEKVEKIEKVARAQKSTKADKAEKAPKPEKAEKPTKKTEKPSKTDKADKAEKVEKVEKAEKVEKPEKSDKSEKAERPEKTEAAPKPKKNQKPVEDSESESEYEEIEELKDNVKSLEIEETQMIIEETPVAPVKTSKKSGSKTASPVAEKPESPLPKEKEVPVEAVEAAAPKKTKGNKAQ